MGLNSSFFDSNKNIIWQFALGIIVLVIFLSWSYWLSLQYIEYSFGFLSIIGALFGWVLQRSRFCFYCIFTDFFSEKDAQGILGILVALLIGTLGYHAVFGAFLPILDGKQLPPDAHIGVVSWVLPFSALSFGLGMAFAGSCISAQLYRFGEGVLTAPVAIVGTLIGFALGFVTWNSLYLTFMQSAQALWLPNLLGYAGSILLQVILIGGLILFFLNYQNRKQQNTGNTDVQKTQSLWALLFKQRWPTWMGGILVAAISVIAYFRVGALGVTAELGSISRTVLDQFWSVNRLEGLDRFTGCMTIIKETVFSNNGVFVLSLVVGSFISTLIAGQFKFQGNTLKATLRIFFGGILMGWGAMVSLGCTVGVLLSGIMAGAVSGWIFAIFCVLGAWLGWKIRRAFG